MVSQRLAYSPPLRPKQWETRGKSGVTLCWAACTRKPLSWKRYVPLHTCKIATSHMTSTLRSFLEGGVFIKHGDTRCYLPIQNLELDFQRHDLPISCSNSSRNTCTYSDGIHSLIPWIPRYPAEFCGVVHGRVRAYLVSSAAHCNVPQAAS